MGYQDESGRRLNYGSYLRIPELLQLQVGLTDAHDELLFIIAHQAYELWFKELIHELVAVRASIDRDDLHQARYYLRRVTVIEALLTEQVGVLETMAPRDFLAFRSELAPASGFQSTQFREIEFLSGLKDPGYMKTLAEPPRRPCAPPAPPRGAVASRCVRGVCSRAAAQPCSRFTGVRRMHVDLFDLSEALLDHDEGFSLWRSRHIHMVERQIGDKPGTGGSTGVRYLQTTLGKRFFPELWQVRSQL